LLLTLLSKPASFGPNLAAIAFRRLLNHHVHRVVDSF
jgi:hypothetical protein